MATNPIGSRGIESPTPLRDGSDLTFASVGLAAALALTLVLAFAAMLGSATVVSKLSGAERRGVGAGLCRLKADSSPAEQTGHGRTGEQDFRAILGFHIFFYVFFLFVGLFSCVWRWPGFRSSFTQRQTRRQSVGVRNGFRTSYATETLGKSISVAATLLK